MSIIVVATDKQIKQLKNDPNWKLIKGGRSMKETLKEKLADYAHDAWSRWMCYLFISSKYADDGTVIIPKWAVERWNKQINMPYADLPEKMKKSDRDEADKMIAIMQSNKEYLTGDRWEKILTKQPEGDAGA